MRDLPGGLVTIDPDATLVDTYGPNKEGSKFSYRGEVGLSPLIGVCGETGDVLAIRARGGNANPGRGNAGFVRECVSAIPGPVRESTNLWVRVDSAGYQHDVFDTAEELGAVFTVTAPQRSNVRAKVRELATNPDTNWIPALAAETKKGSEVAETLFEIGKGKTRRLLRMIVRRQRTTAGDQLAFDDLDGWRFHAIVTNLPGLFAPAEEVEAHHRLRGGIPEDTIPNSKKTSGSSTRRCGTSSGTGCGGTPQRSLTTPPAGCVTSGCPQSSNGAAGNGSGWRSSTWPPVLSTTPVDSSCVSHDPTPGPTRSSKPSPAYGHSQRSPDPARHPHPDPARTTRPTPRPLPQRAPKPVTPARTPPVTPGPTKT